MIVVPATYTRWPLCRYRASRPVAITGGVPPTAPKARTGELTPPGNTDRARENHELDWSPKYTTIDSIVDSAWRWHRNHPDGYTD